MRGVFPKMTKDRIRYRMCARKVPHDSKFLAQQSIKPDAPPTVHAYRCPFCGKWHIGKSGV